MSLLVGCVDGEMDRFGRYLKCLDEVCCEAAHGLLNKKEETLCDESV